LDILVFDIIKTVNKYITSLAVIVLAGFTGGAFIYYKTLSYEVNIAIINIIDGKAIDNAAIYLNESFGGPAVEDFESYERKWTIYSNPNGEASTKVKKYALLGVRVEKEGFQTKILAENMEKDIELSVSLLPLDAKIQSSEDALEVIKQDAKVVDWLQEHSEVGIENASSFNRGKEWIISFQNLKPCVDKPPGCLVPGDTLEMTVDTWSGQIIKIDTFNQQDRT